MSIDRENLQLVVNENPQGVSVTWWGHGLDNEPDPNLPQNHGVAEATRIGDEWWVNRVLVQGDNKGLGIGGHMLETLKKAVVRQGCTSLRVTPGGYGSDTAAQNRFYEAHGFVSHGEEGFVWVQTPRKAN